MPARVITRASVRKLAAVNDDLKPIQPYVAVTYSSPTTCPSSCFFNGEKSACYALCGVTKAVMERLRAGAARIPNVSDFEAAAIREAFPKGVPQDGTKGGCDLRLHIGGDTDSIAGTKALAEVAEWYQQNGGGDVWTYTHRWREIPYDAWGSIRVFASVETIDDAQAAISLRYPVALAVSKFPSTNIFTLNSLRFFPCAWETHGITCVKCRFCLEDTAIKKGLNVAFSVHGNRVRAAREKLEYLNRRPSNFIIDPAEPTARHICGTGGYHG